MHSSLNCDSLGTWMMGQGQRSKLKASEQYSLSREIMHHFELSSQPIQNVKSQDLSNVKCHEMSWNTHRVKSGTILNFQANPFEMLKVKICQMSNVMKCHEILIEWNRGPFWTFKPTHSILSPLLDEVRKSYRSRITPSIPVKQLKFSFRIGDIKLSLFWRKAAFSAAF